MGKNEYLDILVSSNMVKEDNTPFVNLQKVYELSTIAS